jgi:hypothetical protein
MEEGPKGEEWAQQKSSRSCELQSRTICSGSIGFGFLLSREEKRRRRHNKSKKKLEEESHVSQKKRAKFSKDAPSLLFLPFDFLTKWGDHGMPLYERRMDASVRGMHGWHHCDDAGIMDASIPTSEWATLD